MHTEALTSAACAESVLIMLPIRRSAYRLPAAQPLVVAFFRVSPSVSVAQLLWGDLAAELPGEEEAAKWIDPKDDQIHPIGLQEADVKEGPGAGALCRDWRWTVARCRAWLRTILIDPSCRRSKQETGGMYIPRHRVRCDALLRPAVRNRNRSQHFLVACCHQQDVYRRWCPSAI